MYGNDWDCYEVLESVSCSVHVRSLFMNVRGLFLYHTEPYLCTLPVIPSAHDSRASLARATYSVDIILIRF